MTAARPHRSFDSEPPDEVPAGSGQSRQRAIIQHELLRVRRHAEAARLEAQASRLDAAAEQLECLLKRIDAGDPISPAQLADLGLSETELLSAPTTAPSQPPVALAKSDAPPSPADIRLHEAIVRFESWQAIRDAQNDSAKKSRYDAAHPSLKPPQMRRRAAVPDQDSHAIEIASTDEMPEADELPEAHGLTHAHSPTPKPPDAPDAPDAARVDANLLAPQHRANKDLDQLPTVTAAAIPPDSPLLLDDASDKPTSRRRRSAALLTSAVVHLILLILLAGFTLTTVLPKDQVALSASTSEASEEAIQTFQIETVQPAVDPSETTPEETPYDLDPLGEMAVVEVAPGAIAATSPPPTMGSLGQPTSAADSTLQALQSDSKSKMQFCGVEGGGNHFVYLVDSSGSMGDAFISARRALLESIDMLSDQQRFYVIFFDANCDYMRITRADQDEPASVRANQENKQRLKSWAMRVEMDRGKAPYEPLQYALKKLKPDVIFLLSDGEFPQGIEDLIIAENRVSNLFGETNPVSIIHTISYHSREGESRMRRIAENNFGQYRHVPKP